MGKSGNPAKAAEQLRISQIGDFKKRMGGVMELPSGVVVKLKNPGGMRAFLGADNIPNSLMVIIDKALKTKQAPKVEDIIGEGGKIDPAMMRDMMSLFDIVALQTIVEPPVLPAPTQADVTAWNEQHPDDPKLDPEQLRDENLLYIDEFPDDDKQFIFQWVTGGVKDLETFRKRQQEGVDSLGSVAGLADIALSDARANAG